MLRRLLPLSRLGLALWAWRNRASIAGWTQFAGRSASSLVRGGSLDDARAELRLRAALSADKRTRGAALGVSVVDGVAHVTGRAPADARDAAGDIARATRGVARVHEAVEVPARSRRLRPRLS
jgi:osmotically-inducible protein OsmY